jgi:hypothetical protein
MYTKGVVLLQLISLVDLVQAVFQLVVLQVFVLGALNNEKIILNRFQPNYLHWNSYGAGYAT